MMLQTFSLASSPNAATVRVDKATSEFLLAPDWTMNIEICDVVNSDPWTAKEAIKQVKKRLQHKNPRVQLLSLTLLETIVKNCGEHIHFHLAERKILDEMVKLAKKRGDMQVRDKVLVLLDHWQEAFGGAGGKHAQYYWAYDELRRSGVQFPRRSSNSVPIITPPASQPPAWQPSAGSEMASNSSRRLDEAMASEVGSLSSTTLESMRNVMELLTDMLRAVNPNDRMAVKDEIIVDLIEECRTNQKKLIQMLPNVVDEGLLAQGIELNEALQGVLAKHDAIASGSPLPTRMLRNEPASPSSTTKLKSADTSRNDSASTTFSATSSSFSPPSQATKLPIVEEEEEDDFAQLAKRHAKRTHVPAEAASSSNSNVSSVSASDTSVSSPSNALVLTDPPVTVSMATNEKDMVDLLSIVLSSSFTSEETTPKSAPAASQSHSTPNTADDTQQATNFNTYVAPWAQAESQPQPQPQMESSPLFSQGRNQQHTQHRTNPTQQSCHSNYSYNYAPPPWAATPGYLNGHVSTPNNHGYGNQQQDSNNNKGASSSTSLQNPQPSANQLGYVTNTSNPPSNEVQGTLQRGNSLPRGCDNGSGVAMNGVSASTTSPTTMGQKPAFVPHYRLFEDLNVFGNSEGKMRSGPYSAASGNSSQNMVGGRR